MKLLTCLLTTLFALSLSLATAHADDQSDITFDEGVVLLLCSSGPDELEMPKAVFDVGFPQWIEALQKQADAGNLIRAHYLGTLRQGVFAVVGGKDREAARENAEAIKKELDEITMRAFATANVNPEFEVLDACRMREIGPVAILPR